jgi:hypothetical protein
LKHYNRYLTEGEAYLVNGSVPPEPISYDIFRHEAGDPFEEPDFDGLDTQSVGTYPVASGMDACESDNWHEC